MVREEEQRPKECVCGAGAVRGVESPPVLLASSVLLPFQTVTL